MSSGNFKKDERSWLSGRRGSRRERLFIIKTLISDFMVVVAAQLGVNRHDSDGVGLSLKLTLDSGAFDDYFTSH